MSLFRQSIYQTSKLLTSRQCLYTLRTSILTTLQNQSLHSTPCSLKTKQRTLNVLDLIQPSRLPGSALNSTDRMNRVFHKYLTNFPKSSSARRKARKMGISYKKFDEISETFVVEALAGNIQRCTPQIIGRLMSDEGPDGVIGYILSSFYEYAQPYMPKEIQEEYNSLRKLSDLRFPSEWFPEARQMQRKIILHVGPTNSGKTYKAIQRLQSAESGIYCGPLRLLAHEVFDKMNDKGIPCNLLTGEERREVSPTAPLTSSTVEMANLNKPLEVAVIDEIQLISDPFRGWAWTNALLGLRAKEIHLCGEASAVPLVKAICEELNEEVIVNEYSRLTPVNVCDTSLHDDWNQIRKGDCVISFARRNIFNIKKIIEKQTGLKCAVAYGGLPPETRNLQAKAFNDPNNPIDVLVASDAVGMGLNLNIGRIVFSTISKFDGKIHTRIPIPQLKQIAGRAGRFGTIYGSGEVTTMSEKDIQYVKECLEAPIIPLQMAGLQPTVDIFEVFALQMPNEKYSTVLQKFVDMASLDGNYFLCNFRDQIAIADRIERLDLPLRDRYQFVNAPVTIRNDEVMDTIEHMAEVYSLNKTLELSDLVQLPSELPENSELLETSHKQIMLYMWLSLRFPDSFITLQDEALEMKTKCENMIDQVLTETSQVDEYLERMKRRQHRKKKYKHEKVNKN
ncbi:unnamed protein product [Cunninghamella blakesleeana]